MTHSSPQPRRSARLRKKNPPPPKTTTSGIPIFSVTPFATGRNTASALSVINQEFNNQVIEPVRKKRKLDNAEEVKFFTSHFDAGKKAGNSYVKSTKDEHDRNTSTFGIYDPNTARTGRNTTPDAEGNLENDERGHGFPQSNVVTPESADKAEHMTAENHFVNQGVTRRVETFGEKLAKNKKHGRIAKFREPIYLDPSDKRPDAYHERVLSRSKSGSIYEHLSVINKNPVLDKSGKLLQPEATDKDIIEALARTDTT